MVSFTVSSKVNNNFPSFLNSMLNCKLYLSACIYELYVKQKKNRLNSYDVDIIFRHSLFCGPTIRIYIFHDIYQLALRAVYYIYLYPNSDIIFLSVQC